MREACSSPSRGGISLDELITQNASINVLESHARTRGFTSMAEDGLRRVRDGLTTIDEVSRVVDLTENIA